MPLSLALFLLFIIIFSSSFYVWLTRNRRPVLKKMLEDEIEQGNKDQQ